MDLVESLSSLGLSLLDPDKSKKYKLLRTVPQQRIDPFRTVGGSFVQSRQNMFLEKRSLPDKL